MPLNCAFNEHAPGQSPSRLGDLCQGLKRAKFGDRSGVPRARGS